MPTAPAAPDLLTSSTGCLRIRSMAAARGRLVRSTWPPGGNGLTIVIGRPGNGSSARAADDATPRVATRANRTDGSDREKVMTTSANAGSSDGGRGYIADCVRPQGIFARLRGG